MRSSAIPAKIWPHAEKGKEVAGKLKQNVEQTGHTTVLALQHQQEMDEGTTEG